jgi:uncharacterized membrane protein
MSYFVMQRSTSRISEARALLSTLSVCALFVLVTASSFGQVQGGASEEPAAVVDVETDGASSAGASSGGAFSDDDAFSAVR